MSLIFSYRGNTTTAYYAPGGEERTSLKQGGTVTDIVACSLTGCISGYALDMNSAIFSSIVYFSGPRNTPNTNTFSLVFNLAKATAGTATSNSSIFQFGAISASYLSGFSIQHQTTTDNLRVSMRNEFGLNGGNVDAVYNFANTDFRYLVVVNHGGSTLTTYIDGATLGTGKFTRTFNFAFGEYLLNPMGIGAYLNNFISTFYLQELLVFDHALTGASVASAFAGTPSAFYTASANQPVNSTDPGVSNVVSGTNYTFKGSSLTGTYSAGTYTDPGVANVLSGTSYIFNDSTLTGTYHDGSYSNPGIANVRSGTSYIFNDSTLTGTLSVPTALTGAASTAPINQIKEQIRYVLAENNTATGAPTLDLSSNLDRRVQSILKLNPERIPLNDNETPCVTVFTDSKSPIEPRAVNVSGLNGKRKAEINYKVVGMVYAPNYIADPTEDKGDDEIEYLMENVERVLRAYDDLGGTVNWQFPNAVTYHSASFDEESHYRVGILDLRVTLLY